MNRSLTRWLLATGLAGLVGIGLIRAADPPKNVQPDPQKLLPEPKPLPDAVRPDMSNPQDLLKLLQDLDKTQQSGDPQQFQDAFQEFQKLMFQDMQGNGQDIFPNMQILPFNGPLEIQPFPFNGAFGGMAQDAPLFEDNPSEQLRKTMDETLQSFNKSIAEAQDDETKKSLQAARDNYKKTTEAEIEKLAKNAPKRPAQQQQMQPFNFAPFPRDGANPFGGLLLPGMNVKPRLGVTLVEVPKGMAGQLKLNDDQGVMVNQVLPGSVAAQAGLERFDIILEFAGKPVSGNVAAFIKRVSDAKTGAKLDMVVLRNGERKTIEGIVLAKTEPGADVPMMMPLIPMMQLNQLMPQRNIPGAGAMQNLNTMRMTVLNDTFTMESGQNGVTYTIEGKIADGTKEVTGITIKDGDKTIAVSGVDKVPEKYRGTVEKLLKEIKAPQTPAASGKKRKL